MHQRTSTVETYRDKLRAPISVLFKAIVLVIASALSGCSEDSVTTRRVDEAYDFPMATRIGGRSLELSVEGATSSRALPTDAVIVESQVVVGNARSVSLLGFGLDPPHERVPYSLRFGQGPQELEWINALVSYDGDVVALGKNNDKFVRFSTGGDFVNAGEFPWPVNAVSESFIITGVDAAPSGPVELRPKQDSDSVVYVFDIPNALERQFRHSDEPSALGGASRVVAASDRFIALALVTDDVVGLLDTSTMEERWIRILDERRPSIQATVERDQATSSPTKLITDIAVDKRGYVYVGRSFGIRSEHEGGLPRFQVDVYSPRLELIDTVEFVDSGTPDSIAVADGRIVIASYLIATPTVSVYALPEY